MQEVSLDIWRGERHAVIGPNGAGKSTLFHLISGRLHPTSGSITLNGREIGGLPPHEVFHAGLARNFQVNCLFHTMSARENLRCAALHACGRGASLLRRATSLPDVAERVDAMLVTLELMQKADAAADTLSYAEQRALEIGMAVISGREVVLLDEPTAGMSRVETTRFVELIRALTQGRTLVVVEHDMGVVFSLADRVTVLVHGEVLATGTPADIRANRDVQEAYLGGQAVATQ
jgi:branched-chain amino acid transport system ATP-binding protein